MSSGDIRLGDTIDVKFTTSLAGVPTTLAGSPVIAAYVGNGTTEITAGITLTVDFDGRAGLHNLRVVATSGNGFATASNVQLVFTAGTLSGIALAGTVVEEFSIEARSSFLLAATLASIADSILDRDMATGTDSGSPTVRTVRQALRILRNKVSSSAGTMTVTKENDTTASWTAALTTDAAAEPIITIDPA